MIAFFQRKSTLSLTVVAVSTYFDSPFKGLSFSKRMPSTFYLFVFETFAFGNSSFVSMLLARFSTIPRKNTCISQRVITLLVQKTRGGENYSFSKIFTPFGRVDDR